MNHYDFVHYELIMSIKFHWLMRLDRWFLLF